MKHSNPRGRARALLEDASPGPWSEDDCNVFSEPLSNEREAAILRRCDGSDEPHPDRRNHDEPLGFVCSCGQKRPTCDSDAALIAAAPELLTALCDELDRAEEKVERLREARDEALKFLTGCEVSVSRNCGSCRICAARAALAQSEETT